MDGDSDSGSNYSNEGRNYARDYSSVADSYGGRYSGFDPGYDPSSGNYRGGGNGSYGGGLADTGYYSPPEVDQALAETQRLERLNTLSDSEADQLGLGGISPGSKLNKGFLESLFAPGSMAYRLGLRQPGTTAAQMFDTETAAERADRMNLVGQAVDTTFGTIARMAMPAPVTLALGLYNGYNDYEKNGDLRSALGTALGGQRGVLGAVGNAAKGNYGAALTGALTGRTDPLSANLAGIGVDAAQGKNVQKSLGGLFGGYVGNRFGGPLGGFVGSRAGRGLAGMF